MTIDLSRKEVEILVSLLGRVVDRKQGVKTFPLYEKLMEYAECDVPEPYKVAVMGADSIGPALIIGKRGIVG